MESAVKVQPVQSNLGLSDENITVVESYFFDGTRISSTRMMTHLRTLFNISTVGKSP